MTDDAQPDLADLAAALDGHLDAEWRDDGAALTPWRLPAASRRFAPVPLRLMAEFTSGVRVRLRTDADRLEFEASLLRGIARTREAPANPARFAVVEGGELRGIVDVEETGVFVETPDRRLERGPEVRTRIEIPLGAADAERDVEVWLPHDAAVTFRGVRATRGGRPTRIAPTPPTGAARWLHHGSSISHGGNATTPLDTWPVRAAAELGVEVTNLGFGGNAMLDPMTARALAGAPADVITVKIGINIVGGDTMRRRTFAPALHGFLDLVREGHPETPIALVTAIGCAELEDRPGPLRPGADGRVEAVPRDVLPGDGSLTLAGSRELIAEVVADRSADDPNLHLADGLALLGADEGRHLPDGLHPDDEGYALMATRFAALARDPSTGLGAAFAGVLTPRA